VDSYAPARESAGTGTAGAGEAPPSFLTRWLPRWDRAARWWRAHDTLAYALWAMWCTLFAASAFYGYMLVQTKGVWSAPLDDVFIHFDYARSFARGYPLQWSEGNGYSSGNTSLTYPVVLAVGYWLGFRELNLMLWAAIVACLGIFLYLLCVGGLARLPARADEPGGHRPASRWLQFLIPPAILSMGALDWTLFSGMENAFHLGVWGLCLALALRYSQTCADRRAALCLTSPEDPPEQRAALTARHDKTARRLAWTTGIVGAVLVATRPESGVNVAIFGAWCAWHGHRSGAARGLRGILRNLVAVGLPGVLLLLAHGCANYAFTGEWSANGAIAKLFINNPFMSSSDMWERYLSLLGYIIPRLTHHHFADQIPFGWLIPVVALFPLLSRRLRPAALMMWAHIVFWMLIVGMNNQLRWHNERYAMPAVAWLLVLAALGVGVLASRVASSRFKWLRVSWPARALAAVAIVAVYWTMQAPRMKDQIWFFGRASRNILDQHVTAGLVLKKLGVSRVLVGDAGALIYMSDRPGLDLIGLGGYHAFPFARSTIHGLGATIELIERMPRAERPDVMAIYPSWWGDLPTYFGRYLTAVPVRGNVICGGAEKVLYSANWSTLDREGRPRSLRAGERIVDALDVGDLLSERQHGYNLPADGVGFVRYRVLADPGDSRRDLFDAGRIVPGGTTERALFQAPQSSARLIVRLAPDHPIQTEVTIDGKSVGTLTAERRIGVWQEVDLRLPEGLSGQLEIGLTPGGGGAVHYHVWLVETTRTGTAQR